MVDIDERVVQMKFDATDFDQNTKKTMSTLDKLREKLSFKDVVDNDAMSSIADNVQKVADKAYTIVDRTIDKIKDNIANKLVNFIQDNTIGQLNAGWNKYADMTTSVATLTGQGYGLKQINEQLERLMYFTDETSFKFTDMVGEIGKFTASGQSLEDATTAMMGIAEWAALSGKNANEASRAMYQLSQALGAGQMRLIDWKSIQNLNMDTQEFRKNAIEAAIAVGTLKDNLDGTYTTLVGKKKGSLSFNIREFSDKLTEGAWFTTEVMMEVYSKYSEAVDDIRDVYEKGYYFDTNNKYVAINTTAEAVREIKKSNNELIKRFANEDEEGLKLTSDQINSILLKWKQVAKVVNHVNELDEEGNKIISDEEAAKVPAMYAEYLKEYSEIFQGTEEDARIALQDWEKYVAEFGLKAFEKSFEAKTFVEAIESAKDAASTVWVQIYQDIFGDYDQAKEIWTDLANTLYELFVNRLWDLQENIIGHWKTGGKSTLEKLVKEYKAQIEELRNSTEFGEAEAEQVRVLEAEIANLQKQIDEGTFRDGRKIFMQGIYGFGSGLKSVIMNFRDGWDSLFTTGETGEKLLTWSEKLRVAGFKFYLMMNKLGESDFYTNIAKGVRNLLAPIGAVRNIIHSVVKAFLPSGETFISILNKLAVGFVNLTAKIVPSQETIVNIARVLRGVIAFIKLIGKAAIGFYNVTLKPIFSTIYNVIHDIFSGILSIFAEIGDRMYDLEEGVNSFEALEIISSAIKDTLEGIWYLIKTIIGLVWRVVGPVVGLLYRTIKATVDEIKQLSSGKGGFFGGLAEKFKDIAKKAHDAWFSVNSFKDVFNHYSNQTGLPAFLMMIGDLFDTLITKIGVTIAAIFGLDEAVANGKMSKGLMTLRDIIADIAIGLKWIYTNVIRPILGTLIEGLGNSLHTLGNQWKSGDLKGFLGTLKQIISTFTSLGLLKFVGTINKVFGAGGLLRVFRNGAKALKGLQHWLDMKAMNELSGSILKLAIAFGILAGAAAAISYLPTTNMGKFVSALLIFVGALVASMIALRLIMSAANEARFGLFALAGAMVSIVAAVGIFIFAIHKLHNALSSLFAVEEKYTDENGKEQTRTRKATTGEILIRLASLITPVLATIASIAGIMAIIRRIGGGSKLVEMALTIAGIGVGVFMLVNAIDDLVDIFSRDDTDLAAKITGATVYILVMFTLLALITRLLTNPKMLGSGSIKKSVSGALVTCLTIAGIALVVRGVLIPTLETLADSGYSFLDYVAALVIIAGGMFTIAGAMALMNSGTSSTLQKIGNGIVFILFAKVIQSAVVPMIETFTNMGINGNTVAALILVGITMYIITRTINGIFTSLGELLRAIGSLKAKELVPIIISIGGVIAGIMWLGSYLKENGNMMNVEEVGLILASVGGIILLIGLFAILINREFASTHTNLKNFSKTLTSLTILIAVTALAIGGLVFELNKLFGNDTQNAVITLLAVALTMILVVGGNLQAFASAVSQISLAFAGLTKGKISQVRNMFVILFGAIAGIMLVITVGMAVIAKAYENQTLNLVLTFIFLILGTLALVTTSMYMMESVITNLAKAVAPLTGGKTGKIHQIEVILATTFIGIAGIMLAMSVGSALIGAAVGGYTWESLFPMIGMTAGAILAFQLVAASVEKLALVISGIAPQKLEYTKTILLMILLTIGTMFVILGASLVGIADALQGYTWEGIFPAVGIAAGAVVAFTGIVNSFNKLAKTLDALTGFNLKNIIATMGAILVITGLMSTIMVALMNWMAGNGVGGEQNLMNAAAIILAAIIPFAALAGIIELMIPTAGPFVAAAAKISAAIFLIAAALSVLAGSILLIRNAFDENGDITDNIVKGIDKNDKKFYNTGENQGDEYKEGFKDANGIHSPSDEFKKYGYFIDKGLELGIRKDTKLAKSASKALAVATNESFKKELGIHSPSKVFYENGKFVIRGFVNGANSEYQKNKDMGAAMGEGFAESAKAGMEDTWAGLWDGQEMKDWIENFSKEGGLNFGTEAGKSLFSAFLGEEAADESEVKKQLTAQEQQYISGLRNEKNAIDAEIERLYKEGPPVYGYRDTTSYDIEQYNDTIASLKKQSAKLDEEINKAVANGGGTSKKRTGGIFGGLSDVFDGLGEEFGNVMSSSMLGKLGDWFGAGGEGFNEITAVFDKALGDAGGSAGDKFTSRIFGALGLDNNGTDGNSTFWNVGKNIADGISDGLGANLLIGLESILLKNPMVKGVAVVAHMAGLIDDETYRYIMGATPPSIEEGIRNSSATNLNSDEKVKQAEEELAELRRNPPVSAEEAKYQAQRIQQLTDYIEKSKTQSTTLFIQTDSGKKEHFYEYVPGYDKDPSVGDLFTKYISKKFNVNKLTGDSALGQIFESDEFRNSSSQAWFFGQMQRILLEDKSLYEIIDDNLILSQKGTDIINTLWKTLNNDSVKERNKINGTAGYDDVLATMDLYIKNYDLWYSTGENDASGYINGFTETFGNNVPIFGKLFNSLNQAVKDNQQQKSPSKLYFGIGENDVLGFVDGFEETFPQVIKSVEKDYNLLNNTSITGLNAIVNAVENADNITPTVTPVFDGGQLQNGVDIINNGIDAMTPRVDSAIGSFGIEQTDYTNNLNSLGNRIESTNALVNTLIGMLESGAGVNINVTAEPDPTNIYNLVVDTNRTEFKRTGRNNLAY